MLFALLLLTALLTAAPARAQHHEIAAGETLEISVFRVPELAREVVVDIDGQIAFPPLGQIPAAGMTAPEIAAEIQQRLAGLEIMMDAQVTVGLRAVRPVVIGGDIANPGAIPFERGMTVRRAMALAGGMGALRPSMGMATELRAEQGSIAAELAGRRATLARARAELADAEDISAQDVPGLQGSDQAAVLTLANSLLDAARVESDAQKAFLVRDLDIIADRIERLGEQKEHQRELVEQQAAEVERYSDMQRRGLTPQTRVSEEYRTLNELRSDLAEIEAYITDVGRERESAMHELARHDDRRAATLEAEAQTALTEIGALEARLRGVTAQLTQLGLAGHDAVRVTLYRVTGGQETPVSATESTLLQPGDLVEVELPDSFYGVPQPANIASTAGSPAPAIPRADPSAGSGQQRATP
ncbi:polysaccharide biosynthesis/export family protein [Paracoccus sp. Z118]|uniref:polysaccharide biosynthesis/export family protein n=1 Tax=Paracoccus sp. Z118 TaxID=2851017 RepID=UPI001C2B8F11|nr:polysaccharide biosynthesis/export family protein [Paracoccus sp. Z118]MBV0892985.1 polysaccharide biosynthesis/export family protein [Paracoccus sp. Z118]